uniref:SUI1 domain-containing protein n=1 Tax=Coccolithus braarudii TaxID=221442 RepID=A0A7S0LFE0_9EUKA|mmetsp:Transcript_37429/g.79760  ORF Transcript_37429/g.79760 Transcript_37429/m.79760 type:complete len:112 (+) Transcript_37429:3-338(+)
MSQLSNIVFNNQDLFAEADDSKAKDKSYVHIRIQQRNGRKSLTTVQGLAEDLDFKKILKALKKTFSTNGTVLKDKEMGKVIQLQGDQRKNVADFLVKYKILKKDDLKIHGF